MNTTTTIQINDLPIIETELTTEETIRVVGGYRVQAW